MIFGVTAYSEYTHTPSLHLFSPLVLSGMGNTGEALKTCAKMESGNIFWTVPDKLVHVPELGVDRHNLLTQLLHPIDIILSNNNIYDNNINNNNNKQQQLAIGP